MSDNDLNIQNGSNSERLTGGVRPHVGRIRRASVVAGLAVVMPLALLAGCGSDSGSPTSPTSFAPPASTATGMPGPQGTNLAPVASGP